VNEAKPPRERSGAGVSPARPLDLTCAAFAVKEPMFFGQSVNVARFDQQKYDIFEKLIEKQLSFFRLTEKHRLFQLVIFVL
jgi:hypothetical protein